MEPPTQTTTSPADEKPARRWSGVLWRWVKMRPIVAVLLVMFLLTVAFYAEEDWRGARTWRQYQVEAAGRGVSLDLKTFIPKPVPDAENFAASDSLKPLLHLESSPLEHDLYSAADAHVSSYSGKDRGRRHFGDLVAYQQAEQALEQGTISGGRPFRQFGTNQTDLASRAAAAPKVLALFQPEAELFAQLQMDSTRPYSQFPPLFRPDQPNFPMDIGQLASVKEVCSRLCLKTCAELAAGKSEAALADVKLALALADSFKTQPTLIAYLVRIACLQIAVQPVWEGLAERRWSESQLRELQARFAMEDFLGGFDFALKSERGFGNQECRNLKKDGYGMLITAGYLDPDDWQAKLFKILTRLVPSGWYDFELVNYNKAMDQIMTSGMDPAARTIVPHRAPVPGDAMGFLDGFLSADAMLHHKVASESMTASLPNCFVFAAQEQVTADQVALACALERYRLANGAFPESLGALVPRYITNAPNDVITGKPYHYRRKDGGNFILYSVGWNEKDDGGVPGDTLYDKNKGDWVWEYPVQ